MDLGELSVPKSSAARRLHLGRGLRHLPAAGKAWVALVRDEQMLVGQAATLRCDPFCVDLPTPEVAR